MLRRPLFLLLLLSASAAFCQQSAAPEPVIEGYVTRSVSLANFDANGFPIVAGKNTTYLTESAPRIRISTTTAPYLGQSVTVYGVTNKKKHLVVAERVLFNSLDKTPLSGMALVERVVTPVTPASGSRVLLRADGYLIQINADTKTNFEKPLTAITDVTTNVWIDYHAKSRSDGILLADTATFVQNSVVDKEVRLLDKSDYDPAAVDPDSKQNIAKELFLGHRDPQKIPPYKDAALQARVDRIGTSLIPAYQKALPESDLTKVIFRFQLIDDHKMKDALALPSGVILIPFQIVNTLKDDSQLATVLADNIACVLEKQNYRLVPATQTMTAANLATMLIPGVGTATNVATTMRTKSIQTDLLNQSGRISLGLLHDAGYDIDQAPITWWVLAAGTPDRLPSTSLPPRAANLYKSLGSTWRNYPEVPGSQPTQQTK